MINSIKNLISRVEFHKMLNSPTTLKFGYYEWECSASLNYYYSGWGFKFGFFSITIMTKKEFCGNIND
jgi:hypothetical protein